MEFNPARILVNFLLIELNIARGNIFICVFLVIVIALSRVEITLYTHCIYIYTELASVCYVCLIDVILVSRRNKRKKIPLRLKHGLKKRFHLDVSIPISLITWLINIRDVTLTNYPRSLLNFPLSLLSRVSHAPASYN